MDEKSGFELLRLDRIEKRAEGRLKKALQNRRPARAMRAARLLQAASDRQMSIVMGDVAPYR